MGIFYAYIPFKHFLQSQRIALMKCMKIKDSFALNSYAKQTSLHTETHISRVITWFKFFFQVFVVAVDYDDVFCCF